MDPNDPFPGDPMNSPFDFGDWTDSNEVEVTQSEDEMCDHDGHKEVVPLQEMKGAGAWGFSGQYETAEAMIVCKKCGKSKPAERVDQNPDLGF